VVEIVSCHTAARMTGTLAADKRSPANYILLIIALIFGSAFLAPAQPANIYIVPVPDWVRMVDWSAKAPNIEGEKAEGTHYLLYEHQEYAQSSENFERSMLLMRNETGVQDSGNLTFYFDPGYQQLLLHRLQIHRDGRILDRLDKSKIRLIQNEPELGGHLISGKQTALVFVEDLRVGDVLEYAYTTRGKNPILGEHFSTRFILQGGVPIDRKRLRVKWSSTQPLQLRQNRSETAPIKTAAIVGAEYLWDFTNTAALAFEDFTPASHESYPYVEFSDFDTWTRVVDWALPLYKITDTALPPGLQMFIEQWMRDGSTDEERAQLALHFVQDDLRYTALELGPDSYRPANVTETFERRFGDCKGKVLLLCAIYRAMKIEAWPALVNTWSRGVIANRLPSPFSFNHVIVKLNLGGRTIWLDPTISHQGGALSEHHVWPFRKALVIQPGVTGLEDIPVVPRDRASQSVVSTFKIPDYVAPVQLTIETTYRDLGADNMRETLARTAAKDVQRYYLNTVARFHQGVSEENRGFEFSDDRQRNVLKVTERYRITNFWKFDEAKKMHTVSLYGDSLSGFLTDPRTRLRTCPLLIPFPLRREHETIVHLPDKEWRIATRNEDVDHAAFHFRYRRELAGTVLKFQYACETKVPEIPANQVPGYLARRAEMEKLLGDALQRTDKKSRTEISEINWLMVLIAAFALVVSAAGCVWIWFATRRPVSLPMLSPEEEQLSGLRGWLILVAISVCFAPFTRIVLFGKLAAGYFSLDSWQAIMPGGTAYHPLHGPVLIFEVFGNVFFFTFNILAICLFFGKRRAFPKVFIGIIIANCLFLWIDHFLANTIPGVAEVSDPKQSTQLFRSLFWTIIWTSYMLKSKRVRATFRQPESELPPPLPVDEVIAGTESPEAKEETY
jgi:transglutaminase-like putative cysteine protease